jgi:hypothetical protein
VFIKAVRKGIEEGVYVYKRGDLLERVAIIAIQD